MYSAIHIYVCSMVVFIHDQDMWLDHNLKMSADSVINSFGLAADQISIDPIEINAPMKKNNVSNVLMRNSDICTINIYVSNIGIFGIFCSFQHEKYSLKL